MLVAWNGRNLGPAALEPYFDAGIGPCDSNQLSIGGRLGHANDWLWLVVSKLVTL